MDLGLALELHPELRGTRVQVAEVGLRERPVDRVAQELVAEVVEPTGARRVEDALVHQLAERIGQGRDGRIHDPGEDLGHEAAADDGARAGDRLRLGRQAPDPLEDRVAERLRHGRLENRPAVRPLGLVECAEELLDVERHAVRALVDRVDHGPRRREPRPQDERRHQRGLLVGQRRKTGLLGQSLGEEPGAPRPEDRGRNQLIGPVGAARASGPMSVCSAWGSSVR